jgi:membrane dipeptidase
MIAVSCNPGEEQISRRADSINDTFLSVDTHCDTPMRFFRGGFDPGVRNERGCVDFPRMKEGRLDAEFFAIFIWNTPIPSPHSIR